MFKLFQKEKIKENSNLSLIAIASLLIHSAKIDENFTEKEKKIIKEALIKLGADNNNIDKVIEEAEIKEKDREIKLIPEMLNLLGCGKEDFLKLIKKMNYSSFSKNEDTYFKYIPSKSNKKQFSTKVVKKENPFSILKNIDFK